MTVEHELAEARSEIARHHELIEWMAESMRWLLSYTPTWGDAGDQAFEIKQRLNREVS